MDLSKLPPSPWASNVPSGSEDEAVVDAAGEEIVVARINRHYQESEAACEFIALARNAFDGDPEALAWWEANRRRRPMTGFEIENLCDADD